MAPTGPLEDDPNVTDKKFPGNPTRSYRTREPVRIIGELEGWTGHTPEQLQAMKNGLGDLQRRGVAVIFDWPKRGSARRAVFLLGQ